MIGSSARTKSIFGMKAPGESPESIYISADGEIEMLSHKPLAMPFTARGTFWLL